MYKIIDIEIAIVGAGPAGVAAALRLAKLGHVEGMVLFDRETQIAMTSRHCNHQGFGLMEFKRPMTGEKYADFLQEKIKQNNIVTKLRHTLTDVTDDLLTFSTPDGVQCYRAKKILFALGARETPRSSLLVSGGRSPNIITTGALQRFAYIQKLRPFKKAVIVGSEIVSFSAIMTAKHAGIDIVAIIEEQEKIEAIVPLKYISKYILGVPVYTSVKLVQINTENKEVQSVRISQEDKLQDIECDGVIFSGKFTPESSVLQKSFNEFNHSNNSLSITDSFQTNDERFFLAGNVIRGALTAFNCYFEGQKAGTKIASCLEKSRTREIVPIEIDDDVECWYYPSLIDLNAPSNYLTKIRFRHRTTGVIRVMLNGKEISSVNIDAVPYKSIAIGRIDSDLKKGDIVGLVYEERI